jgi:hypothetical protein
LGTEAQAQAQNRCHHNSVHFVVPTIDCALQGAAQPGCI